MLGMIAATVSAFALPNAGYDEAVFIQTQLERVSALRNKAAAVTSELLVGPDGQVLECTVVRYAGERAVADQVCLLMKRRRLQVPKGPSGAPTYAVVEMTTGYAQTRGATDRLARAVADQRTPDRTIATSVRDRSIGDEFVLLLAIDETGHVTACRPGKEQLIEKVSSYCNYVANEQFAIKTDQGRSVGYIRMYHIGLDPAA